MAVEFRFWNAQVLDGKYPLRMKSHRVLGIKSQAETVSDNISGTKIDLLGRISFPNRVCAKIIRGCEIEFEELTNESIAILLTPATTTD